LKRGYPNRMEDRESREAKIIGLEKDPADLVQVERQRRLCTTKYHTIQTGSWMRSSAHAAVDIDFVQLSPSA